MLSRQFLACMDDPRESGIRDVYGVSHAALAAEVKFDRCPVHGDVLATEGRETVGMIFMNVFLIADAHHRSFEQEHDRRKHFLPAESLASNIAMDASTNPRKVFGEGDQSMELRAVAGRSKLRMVAILLAPFPIPSRRLQVPERIQADPHVGPCRGNDEGSDALQGSSIRNPRSVRSNVGKSAVSSYPTNAGGSVMDVPEAFLFLSFHKQLLYHFFDF